MSSYRGTADRPDKAKAIAAVAAVHVALAAIILSGLNVRLMRDAAQAMTTISIKMPAPPPPPLVRARPRSKPQPVKEARGEVSRKAEPRPVFAPRSSPLPTPLPTAKVAGSQTSTSTGAGLAGPGTGAGGSGSGAGGGGTADYSRFTPARLVENIPNSEYRQLAATGIPSGLVGVIVLVSASGRIANCRIARSSGDASIDALVCRLTVQYVRFDPARDPYGRPVAQDITYFPSWRRR